MTKDDMVRFTFRMPASMFNKLKTEASRMGVSVNSLILHTSTRCSSERTEIPRSWPASRGFWGWGPTRRARKGGERDGPRANNNPPAHRAERAAATGGGVERCDSGNRVKRRSCQRQLTASRKGGIWKKESQLANIEF